MVRTLMVLALLALPFAVNAQEMPRYDVEAHCEEIASFGGEFSNMTYNGCIQMEQSAYDGLKGQWASLPGNIQRHCDEIATFASPGSYSTLQGCVQMEVSAGQNRGQFSFD
ncbi:hypothetical protein HNO53_20825 [Billgrantia antri]|uniref:Uncharacterized protein n=1 Tax=Halomonas sulfidivorans TaxID=2733488 RepID=A0ABX7WPZ3_9GAMM|nr:hypothetical protein [Halomonas sulfidivorans]QTP60943.1 hypothetical protein HNO53_20825 [Halomonas sulfidivorans]